MWSWEGQEKIVINDKGDSSNIGGCALRSLHIGDCQKLRVVPDCMFSPSLEELKLTGDAGVLVHDLFPAYRTLCSITKLTLEELPHLPKGLDRLKTLQSVDICNCKTLDFDLKELAHFTKLRDLYFRSCPLLKENFKGDEWRTILAHLPEITIDYVEITDEDYKQDDLFSSQ